MKFKSRLANHVSPAMHEEVQRHLETEQVPEGVTNRNAGETVSRAKIQGAEMEFVIAKRLLAALPIVPTNERVYELAQDIHAGYYDDISSLEEAESESNWELWKNRTMELLRSKGIVISNKFSRLRKVAIEKTDKKKIKRTAEFNYITEQDAEIKKFLSDKIYPLLWDFMSNKMETVGTYIVDHYLETENISKSDWEEANGYTEFHKKMQDISGSSDSYFCDNEIESLSKKVIEELKLEEKQLLDFIFTNKKSITPEE